MHTLVPCRVVPPYLLARIAESGDPRLSHAARAARASLLVDPPFRGVREGEPPASAPLRTAVPRASTGRPERTVYDANGSERLPGVVVRSEGDDPTGDPAADEAYDGLGATHALLAEAFDRDSVDGAGLPLDATVHYGEDYDNAFWDGRRMVFGDGDGQVFQRFTRSMSVIGHELAHGVTQYTAALEYRDQAGALNESVSDVIGALVEQRAAGQDAAEASWLIGEGLFTDEVQGRALRSMAAPGTAYDDDVLGRDPQPAHMDDFVVTEEDYGGVHINSGIPNRAFHLAAVEIGGPAWRGAGLAWYDALVGPGVGRTVDFGGFAGLTVGAAESRFGGGSRESRAVERAWREVGVLPERG